MDIPLQVSGKSRRREVGVGAHLVEIGCTEGNDVLVGCQNAAATNFSCAGVRFALKHRLDFLRNDRTAEDTRKGVTDGRLEPALEPVDESHTTACLAVRRSRSRPSQSVDLRVDRRRAFVHGIGQRHSSVTNRTLRIGSRQVRALVAASIASPARFGEPGRVRDSLSRLLGRVAEWQTRWLQVPVSFGTWGFKSPFAHNCGESGHRLQMSRVTGYREARPLAGFFCLLVAPVVAVGVDVVAGDAEVAGRGFGQGLWLGDGRRTPVLASHSSRVRWKRSICLRFWGGRHSFEVVAVVGES